MSAPVKEGIPMSERQRVYKTEREAEEHPGEHVWKPSRIYPDHDVCLVVPVAHYRQRKSAPLGEE